MEMEQVLSTSRCTSPAASHAPKRPPVSVLSTRERLAHLSHCAMAAVGVDQERSVDRAPLRASPSDARSSPRCVRHRGSHPVPGITEHRATDVSQLLSLFPHLTRDTGPSPSQDDRPQASASRSRRPCQPACAPLRSHDRHPVAQIDRRTRSVDPPVQLKPLDGRLRLDTTTVRCSPFVLLWHL